MRYLNSAYLRCPRKLIRCGSILQFVCGLSLNFKYPPTVQKLIDWTTLYQTFSMFTFLFVEKKKNVK